MAHVVQTSWPSSQRTYETSSLGLKIIDYQPYIGRSSRNISYLGEGYPTGRLFLHPFPNTTSKTRPFEYLRLTSLGVIGALVKVRHPIQFPHPQTISLARVCVQLTQ